MDQMTGRDCENPTIASKVSACTYASGTFLCQGESRMYEFEEDYEEYEPPVPKRRATISHDVSYYDHPTEELKHPPPKHAPRPRRMRFTTYFIMGMIISLSLWAFSVFVVIPWWNSIVDHWQYGGD